MFLNSFFILVLSLLVSTEGFSEEATLKKTESSTINNNETNAEASSEKSSVFVLCRRGKEQRWLRAFKTDGGKCKTYYSKEGYLQVVSSATYFSSCEAVLENVKKNLEEGSFKCTERDVQAVDEIQ